MRKHGAQAIATGKENEDMEAMLLLLLTMMKMVDNGDYNDE